MENTGFKGLLVTIYQRVILSYKTTAIALLLACADQVVAYYSGPGYPPIVHQIVGVAAFILAMIKEKKPGQPVIGAPVTLIFFCFFLSACATVKTSGKTAGLTFLDCAGVSVAQTGINHAMQAMEAGDGQWDLALAEVEAKFGDCAIKAALAVFEQMQYSHDNPKPGGATALMDPVPDCSAQLKKGTDFLASRGYTIKRN